MKYHVIVNSLCLVIWFSILNCSEKKIYTPGLSWSRTVKSLNWNEAVIYCKKKKMYLPSKEELILGFKSGNKELLSTNGSYWSSSSNNYRDNYAWVVNYEDGNSFRYSKDYYYNVRCVAR